MFLLSDRHTYKEIHNLTGETWMPVDGYNYYLISNYGRVKVLGHTLIDKSGKSKNISTRIMLGLVDEVSGKHTINLNEKGVITTYNTDYLVLKSFSGSDKSCVVIHKDGNEMNCNYDNLCYSDKSSSNELGSKEAKFKPSQVIDGLEVDIKKLFTERSSYMEKYAKRFAVERYINSKVKLVKDACAILYVIDVKKLLDTHRYDYICDVVEEIIAVNKFERS